MKNWFGLRTVAWTLGLFCVPRWCPAQSWDVGARLGEAVTTETDGKLKLGFEQRVRYESMNGRNFGADPDLDTALVRTRLSLAYQPIRRLKFSAMLQDSRAPWYGANAPNTVRDPADLHEGYVEWLPSGKTGFGMSAGRIMMNYGEGRLVGTPQWGNLSRTYDHARAYYSTPRARFEVLLVSPVKVSIGEFNHPVLGDRVWGTYNTLTNLARGTAVDLYFLRHTQNRPGGFTGGSRASGTDKLEVNSAGFRLYGPLSHRVKYSLEGVAQRGDVGPARLRGAAWFSGVNRRWTASGRPLDWSSEYKFASGTPNPQDTTRSRTFDQLYAANHDRFGHEDLFGWRNIHDLRSLTSYGFAKGATLNFMYNELWLASARDSLYNGSGRAIAKSSDGSAGTHVGRETDLFVTYKYRHFQIGAGYGYLFPGEFLRKTTKGVAPSYVYIFHTYTI